MENAPKSRLLHRNLRHDPVTAVSSDGIGIALRDGHTVIDACGGAAVSCIGHGNERVIRAIHRQTAKMAYVHSAFFGNEPAEELAEMLVDDCKNVFDKVLILSSGSEAMESALKLARQYFIELGEPRRNHFIGRRLSYHGNTLGTLSVGGHLSRRNPYEPMFSATFSSVGPCYPYHYQYDTESDAEYIERLQVELDLEFRRTGPDKVAGLCIEPMVGATIGCVAATPGYLAAVRRVCDRYGALLIYDEIMCGMGRTGTLHAWEPDDVPPDIQAVAKGLGGGYQSISAVLVSKHVTDVIEMGSGTLKQGQTYQAHPVACAAALEVQKIIREGDLLRQSREIGNMLAAKLSNSFGDHPHVGDIRGRGSFWALEFVTDRRDKSPFAAHEEICYRIRDIALELGLAVYPGAGTVDGTRGDHVIIAPPFTATEADIDDIVNLLDRAVGATFHERVT